MSPGDHLGMTLQELTPGTQYSINVTSINHDDELGESVRTSARTSSLSNYLLFYKKIFSHKNVKYLYR